jgi:DNA-binding transcriptional LysR family regulator
MGHASRRALPFRNAVETDAAAGANRPQLHQFASAHPWRLYAWEFEKDGRALKVHVEGQLVFNGTFQMLNAALADFGLAYLPEDVAGRGGAASREGPSQSGAQRLVPAVLGYHLYYPSRRRPFPCS